MNKFLIVILGFLGQMTFAQITKDTIKSEQNEAIVTKPSKEEAEVIQDIDSMNAPMARVKYSPTKAGLYSAVLPGLGQYYNKKYWKIPIVWGGIGTGVGIALWNQKSYNRYRDAFIAELNGQTHEFSDIPGVTKEVLGRTQDKFKRQRDYTICTEKYNENTYFLI